MTVIKSIDRGITGLIRLILGLTSGVIFGVTFLAVIFRYLLKSPFLGLRM